MSDWKIHTGDALKVLKTLPEQSIQCCVTSPPYLGLRDYGVEGQVGREGSPDEYVQCLVEIFRGVRSVLRDDGVLWLNLGDSYNGSGGAGGDYGPGGKKEGQPKYPGRNYRSLKPKDLCGIPWRVALALQDDGWWLRADICWEKPNILPENVKDRPTRCHEYVFLLTKSQRYYYDIDAIREPITTKVQARKTYKAKGGSSYRSDRDPGMMLRYDGVPPGHPLGRNKRTVWKIPAANFKGAHFAVMPEGLAEPCVLAGSAYGDTVLDPFCGSGTTGVVALRYKRQFVGIELNPDYVKLAEGRLRNTQPDIFAALEAGDGKEDG